jgi:hypothetical protein
MAGEVAVAGVAKSAPKQAAEAIAAELPANATWGQLDSFVRAYRARDYRPEARGLQAHHRLVLFAEGVALLLALSCVVIARENSSGVLHSIGTAGAAILVGCAIGALVGTLLSPGTRERGEFADWQKAVGGVVSGFLLGKLEKLGALSPLFRGAALETNTLGLGAGIVGFTVGAITLFMLRRYVFLAGGASTESAGP